MMQSTCRVLVTGANGFIGKNLMVRLNELSVFTVTTFTRGDDVSSLPALLSNVDAVVHLAGVNRPQDERDFAVVNKGLTEILCDAIRHEAVTSGRKIQLILASSMQASHDNAYGRSKLSAEIAANALSVDVGNSVVVFRLPGVFGKWCKPNYNSVVATFCYNIARDLPIKVNDPMAALRLVYVDDVVSALIAALQSSPPGAVLTIVQPEFNITLGDLAAQIRAFASSRVNLMIERVGAGLVRALYSTYVSYLPKENFSYSVPQFSDSRGVFVEMLKTLDSGQFSYFTAHPGVTRGGHYHHSKTEKFLVIKGQALFRFRNLLTNEQLQIRTSGENPQVVDTIPGYVHDITNLGNEEMVVMLWANEIFDRERTDTFNSEI